MNFSPASELSKIKFGIRLPTFALGAETDSYEVMCDYVEEVERLGFEHIWFIDHALPMPKLYRCSWLEPLGVIASLIGRTKKLKFGSLILVVPLRHPVILAKTIATLDFLSGGRFILGAGLGANKLEFDAVGVSMRERGMRMTESVEIMKRLWTEDDVSYEGKFYRFENVTIEPKPIQKPHPPIWFSGGSLPPEFSSDLRMPPPKDTLFERIARFGNGWVPYSPTPGVLVRNDWGKICTYAKKFGRDPASIDIIYENFIYILNDAERDLRAAETAYRKYSLINSEAIVKDYLIGTPDNIISRIEERKKGTGGVQHIIFNPLTYDKAQLHQLAEKIIPFIKD